MTLPDNEFAKIEYEKLYQEILDNFDKIYRVLNLSIPTTALLVGYLLTIDVKADTLIEQWLPLFFLSPFFVIIPSMLMVISALNSTARIASYLRVFYEEKLQVVSWQIMIQALRNSKQSVSSQNRKQEPRKENEAKHEKENEAEHDKEPRKGNGFLSGEHGLICVFLALCVFCFGVSLVYACSSWSIQCNESEITTYMFVLSLISIFLILLFLELRKKQSGKYFEKLAKFWRDELKKEELENRTASSHPAPPRFNLQIRID